MKEGFARVAVPRPVEEIFHYSIPENLKSRVAPGCTVTVPFGRKSFTGLVVDIVPESPVKTRPILSVAGSEPLSENLIELVRWTSSYYQSPPGMIARMTMPPSAGSAGIKFRLTEKGRSALDPEGSDRELGLLDSLKRGPRTSVHLEKSFSSEEVEQALGAGLIEEVASRPDISKAPADTPAPEYAREEEAVVTLTSEQEAALKGIGDSINRGKFSTTLLMGVTGSGKTEVYLRAAKIVLSSGGAVLLLVPEISLTPLLTSRLESQVPGGVAVIHSGLTPSGKRKAWEAVQGGKASLVVGVRSAVFTPVPKLGLIIVDEEHDGSFRQEEAPSYNARDVAVKRGQLENVPVILGTATPSLESFRNTETGKYALLTLPERVSTSQDPKVVVVNMSDPDVKKSDHPFVSDRLMSALTETVQGGSQAMLFLNRRGFSPFLLCSDCNFAMPCPNCEVTLTYHRARGMLCHYCGHLEKVPEKCPQCSSGRLTPVGTGTQRLEAAISSALPDAVIERLDRDTVVKRGMLADIYRRMDGNKIQVLVGTQIIAKGHDFANVTLVGILNAEQALDFPDFRSAERTYQLITQVAGRAGRGKKRGTVIVQSYFPDHYAVSLALKSDYRAFYEKESEMRRQLGYPPFGRMGRIIVDGLKQEAVQKACSTISGWLSGLSGLRVLGPSPAPLPRILNRHRWHLLLLAENRGLLSKALKKTREKPLKNVRVHVRVDPYHLM